MLLLDVTPLSLMLEIAGGVMIVQKLLLAIKNGGVESPICRYADLRIVYKMQAGRMAGIKMLETDSLVEWKMLQYAVVYNRLKLGRSPRE